jgi:thioredoxin 1
MSEGIKVVDDESFDEEVLKSDKPVLVDFFADWCAPCRALSKTLEEIKTLKASDLKICKVDIEKSLQLAVKFNVRSIPYLILMKNGQMVSDIVGNHSKDDILKIVEKHL